MILSYEENEIVYKSLVVRLRAYQVGGAGGPYVLR